MEVAISEDIRLTANTVPVGINAVGALLAAVTFALVFVAALLALDATLVVLAGTPTYERSIVSTEHQISHILYTDSM